MLTVYMLGEELCGVVQLHVPSCGAPSFLTPATPAEECTYNPIAAQPVSGRFLPFPTGQPLHTVRGTGPSGVCEMSMRTVICMSTCAYASL